VSHVVFLIPGLDRISGAERQVMLLAAGLAKRDWRVTVIALTGVGGEAAESLALAGITFLSLHMGKGVADPRGWARLHHWLRANRPDILHAHLPHASWMARVSRAFAPVRVVLDTIHTSAATPPARRMAYRSTTRLSDCVTAVSSGVAAACRADRIAKPDGIIVIPNGIDTAAWTPDSVVRAQVREELGLRDEFLWCAIGRLEPVKDHALLLHALAALPAQAYLVIAGSGRLEPELRSLTRDLQLESRVRFLGFQADPRRWLQAADGFALTSRWEGLPMTLLEAGACGLPCVATDVSGVREIVDNGATGFVAAPRNVGSFRTEMMRLMSTEPAERLAMGIRARHRIVERFGMDAVLDAWEKLYGEMLADRPVPRRFASRMRRVGASTATPAPQSPA
jgi:glycosyltransferase involved in cell wall biosynthesis